MGEEERVWEAVARGVRADAILQGLLGLPAPSTAAPRRCTVGSRVAAVRCPAPCPPEHTRTAWRRHVPLCSIQQAAMPYVAAPSPPSPASR